MPIPREHKGDSKLLHILPSSHGKHDATKCGVSNQGYCTHNHKWCCDCTDIECLIETLKPLSEKDINMSLVESYQSKLKLDDATFSIWLGFSRTMMNVWKLKKRKSKTLPYKTRVRLAKRLNLYSEVK